MITAPLYEIFSSVQGEATRVGERHLFVRLAGCDLECTYCDTPASRRIPGKAHVFLPSGTVAKGNPMSRDVLDECVTRIDEEAGPHHAVAITGGEPLLFVDFLVPLLDTWSKRGWSILLETGGHRPDDLERIIEHVDIVMADIKVESSAGFAIDTKRFLEIASQKECAAKIVCNAHTTEDEITAAARMVRDDVPLILQPVYGSAFHPPKGNHMLALQRAAMRVHEKTRVIPQTHRTLHLR